MTAKNYGDTELRRHLHIHPFATTPLPLFPGASCLPVRASMLEVEEHMRESP
jgi:hypothetical protein